MNESNMIDGLLSEREAAKRLGVSRITMLRMRQDGRIKFYRIGARVLFADEHLRDFLATVERNGLRKAESTRRGIDK
jgi:excisionase family DNA binding protein